jgi:hypothetical protein
MYKGNDYDRELKKHGVSIDRVKPDPAPRELDHEKPDETSKHTPSRK